MLENVYMYEKGQIMWIMILFIERGSSLNGQQNDDEKFKSKAKKKERREREKIVTNYIQYWHKTLLEKEAIEMKIS
jgi:hypothetical protein